jgi:hypothetical protein
MAVLIDSRDESGPRSKVSTNGAWTGKSKAIEIKVVPIVIFKERYELEISVERFGSRT